MRRGTILGVALIGSVVAVIFVLSLVGRGMLERHLDSERSGAPVAVSPVGGDASPSDQGFLYGRVLAVDGSTYEGRLRWGGDEEAFWGDYFNGFVRENPWSDDVSPELLEVSSPVEIFGFEIARRERASELDRPFMARFGDIARIEADGRDLAVRLKSGSIVRLDRWSADDFSDGLRVWDPKRGVVDLGERRVRAVELQRTPGLGSVPRRLYGTVRTRHQEFAGFVQWDRQSCVVTDIFRGDNAEGGHGLRFETIASIARRSQESALVTLVDGREVELAGTRDTGDGNRGVYVDDPRYGRVLVSWDAFDRIDFAPHAESGPAYDDFPPGRALTGSVTTRDGRRLVGRLVYDLDESETTATLDARSEGVTYTLPFGAIASIVFPTGDSRADVTVAVALRGGRTLHLDRNGDLGPSAAGVLIYLEDSERPEYVRPTELARIDLEPSSSE